MKDVESTSHCMAFS